MVDIVEDARISWKLEEAYDDLEGGRLESERVGILSPRQIKNRVEKARERFGWLDCTYGKDRVRELAAPIEERWKERKIRVYEAQRICLELYDPENDEDDKKWDKKLADWMSEEIEGRFQDEDRGRGYICALAEEI